MRRHLTPRRVSGWHEGPCAPLRALLAPAERDVHSVPLVRIIADSRLCRLDDAIGLWDVPAALGAAPDSATVTGAVYLPGWTDPEGLEPRVDRDGRVTAAAVGVTSRDEWPRWRWLAAAKDVPRLLVLPVVPDPLDVARWAREDAPLAAAAAAWYAWRHTGLAHTGTALVDVLCRCRPLPSTLPDGLYARRCWAAADALAAHQLEQPGEFDRLRSAALRARKDGHPTPDGMHAPAWWPELF